MRGLTALLAVSIPSFLSLNAAWGAPIRAVPAGMGTPMNPDLSVNISSKGAYYRTDGAAHLGSESGFHLDEVELQLGAAVDPYLKALALLSVARAPGGDEAPQASGSAAAKPRPPAYEVSPEEAYVETTSLPLVTLRVGRFKVAMGRHNQLHAHAFPFVDAPLIHQRLLGDDGWSDPGVAAYVLIPAPWYLEVTGQLLAAESSPAFAPKAPGVLTGLARVRNLWELTASWTLDVGLAAATGANYWGQHTQLRGADLGLKWRPRRAQGATAVTVAAEALRGHVGGRAEEPELSGGAAWIIWQLPYAWRLGARGEEVGGGTAQSMTHTRKASVLWGYAPSEFSDLRLQFDRERTARDPAVSRLSLQMGVSIGVHPAHTY